MTKLCTGCKQPIHPKRLEILPSVTRCVACSTATKKAGVTVTKGTGDHTYTETVIMEHDEFVKYKEAEAKLQIEEELTAKKLHTKTQINILTGAIKNLTNHEDVTSATKRDI